jgi:N-acetylmuramoyl-L-alanine amidase
VTREELRGALTDRNAFIATLWGEVRGEPLAGIVAAGCVIRNRATNPRWWGSGYRGVCLAKHQFSCWWEDTPNTRETYAVAEALLARQPMGEQTALSEIAWVVDGLMGSQLRDITRGADHYLTRQLYRTNPPIWAMKQTPIAEISAHCFFRLET